MDHKPKQKAGFPRIWAAFIYSLNGLRFAIFNEAAFRQEAFVAVIFSIVLLFLPVALIWKGVLFFATVSVLVVELLNSAIESVVNIASPEYHLLAKRAKDLGSAAVFFSICLAIVLWSCAIVTIIQS
jgi:diacylglycerol kinase (ATP)